MEFNHNTFFLIQADKMESIAQTNPAWCSLGFIHPGDVLLSIFCFFSMCGMFFFLWENAEEYQWELVCWTASNIMLVSSRFTIKMMRVKQMACRPIFISIYKHGAVCSLQIKMILCVTFTVTKQFVLVAAQCSHCLCCWPLEVTGSKGVSQIVMVGILSNMVS